MWLWQAAQQWRGAGQEEYCKHDQPTARRGKVSDTVRKTCCIPSNHCKWMFYVCLLTCCQVRASKAEAKVGWTNQPAEDERDYSSCDLEVMSQSLILPPTDRPYFLLLQGYDQSKARHADRSYHTNTEKQHTHTQSFMHIDTKTLTNYTIHFLTRCKQWCAHV